MYQEFGEQITFRFVYIVESHPNFVPHAKSLAERAERAESLCTEANSSMVVLLDDMQNSVADAYHVFDEKAVMIDQGRIVFFNEGSPEGPDFRLAEDLRNAIVERLNRQNV